MNAPEGFRLFNGFQYQWKRFPHRLSRLEAGIISGQPHFRARVGNFAPEPGVYIIYSSWIEIPQLSFRVIEISLRLEGLYEQFIASETVCEFSLPVENGIAHKAESFLQSFSLQPVNNPAGWHFGALGLNCGAVSVDAQGNGKVVVTAHARPTYAPEPFSHGNKNWNHPPHPHCVYEVRASICVVSALPHLFDSHVAWINGVSLHKGAFSHTDVVFQDKAPAFVGLKGFSFRLADEKVPGRGRYLRGMGAWIQEKKAQLIFSNKGPVTFPYELSYDQFLSAVCLKQSSGEAKVETHKGCFHSREA